MNTIETTKREREYLERIPFVTELLKRIDDISQAIKQGYTGVEEALNLITDLPDPWRADIQKDLDNIQAVYELNKKKLREADYRGLRPSEHDELLKQKIDAGKDYSRNVKQKVINLLDSKGLLILSRNVVPESDLIDMFHDNDEQKDEDY